MRRLLIAILILLAPCSSFAGSAQIRVMMGMWGAVQSASEYTTVFSDDFGRSDSATVGGDWDSETDTANQLSIVSGKLTYVDDSATASYVSKSISPAITEGKITFTYSTSTTNWSGTTKYIRVLNLRAGATESILLSFREGGIYTQAFNEANTATAVTTNYTFTGGSTYNIEVLYKISDTTDSNNGYYKVLINGVEVYALENFDNYGKSVDSIRLGCITTSAWTADDGISLSIDDLYVYKK